MFHPATASGSERNEQRAYALRFTPAEWRFILQDRGFLKDRDNRFQPPRRLMGLPVVIVPDHGPAWLQG